MVCVWVSVQREMRGVGGSRCREKGEGGAEGRGVCVGEGRREIERSLCVCVGVENGENREGSRERDRGLCVSACVMFVCVHCCVRVWLRALCVCVGFLLSGLRTHSGTSNNFYNYFDNFRPWTKIMVISLKRI